MKAIVGIISCLLISSIPLFGAYISYYGPKWVNAGDGTCLALSSIFLSIGIAFCTLCYLFKDE